ncbi:MAG: 50S ribosomal protein L32 [Myxococcota bacterium]
MAVPKRKKSKSRRDMRRSSHWKLAAPTYENCPQCGAVKRPHRICPECGFYKGKEVVHKETKA